MSLTVAEGLRLRSGRYVLRRRLGRGAAATVWLADDTRLERRVAVKLLAEGLVEDSEWLARFRREARVAARLQHPNLVPVYDFEAESDPPYLVMSYLSGGSLQDRLSNGGAPDPERVASDLMQALEHIHAAGIVHRDVKPANLLFERDGRACLTDFGVARPQDATSITQTGQIPGTARYMAPELWRGEPADERTDLFAAGVLLGECLNDSDHGPLADLARRLRADDPEARPESAAEALDLLGAKHGPEPTAVERTAPAVAADPELPTLETERVASPAATRWPLVVALSVLALVAGLAIARGIGGDDEPRAAGDGAGAGREQEPAADATGAGAESGRAASQEAAEPAADGAALNDQGYALIQEGAYDDAVPVLEQAVAALEGSDDLTYAYALFNLGNALRLAGRPEEAIPVLQRRLEIPNQQSVVAAELEQAEQDAANQANAEAEE